MKMLGILSTARQCRCQLGATVRSGLSILTAILVLAFPQLGRAAPNLWSSDGLNHVNVQDLNTDLPVTVFGIGYGPKGIAFTPNGLNAYISVYGASMGNPSQVVIVNTKTYDVEARVSVGDTPLGIAITPDGQFAYVAISKANSVSVISATTKTVIATIPVGVEPKDVVVRPDGRFVYVANHQSHSVSVIDTTSNTVTATILLPNIPYSHHQLAIRPDGLILYASNSQAGVSVIDTTTNQVVSSIAIAFPGDVVFSATGGRAYVVTSSPYALAVIDGSNHQIIESMPAGSYLSLVAVSPDERFAYTYESWYGTYKKINLATKQIEATVAIGSGIAYWAIEPANSSADRDNDGIPDEEDNCPDASNAGQEDSDYDFVGNACDVCPVDSENDLDLDGVCGDVDNCPTVANPEQDNADAQGAGDACIEGNDNDGDLWENELDNCPSISNANQLDSDGEGSGDVCDTCAFDPFNDADFDGRCANEDNCPETSNSDQLDADEDGLGDACDTDRDNDRVQNAQDNCPLVSNADQADFDGDGEGDACDTDIDGDSVHDAIDRCPMTLFGAKTDADGCAVSQMCPCDGAWRTHGQFVSCTAKVSSNFVMAGLLTPAERDALVGQAAQGNCGHRFD